MKKRSKRKSNVLGVIVSFFTKDFGLKCLSLVLATAIYFALAPDWNSDSPVQPRPGVAASIVQKAGESADKVLPGPKTPAPAATNSVSEVSMP